MISDPEEDSIDGFPKFHGGGVLLGIKQDGLAAYYEDDCVYLAEIRDGQIHTPPRGYSPMHSLELEGFDWSIPEYIRNTANDEGLWQALSDFAQKKVTEEGDDPTTFTE